ncbi:MAG: hypothetical protein NUV77_03100, partial [Thermoguttaceae bacterium]|nr:hypothetical protein [Thermoguttaceae bacterium]
MKSWAAVRRGLKRAAGVLGLAAAATASLLTFPCAVPWMIAAWLAWHTALVVRSRPGYAPVAIGAVIVAVKRVPSTLALLGLAAVLAAWLSMCIVVRVKRGLLGRRLIVAGTSAIWLAWVVLIFDWHYAAHRSRSLALDPGRPIVCFGNSMTSMGPPRGGYPRLLRRLVAAPVLDFGVPGLTTSRALACVPQIVQCNPQAVVLEIGGNDYL